MMSVTNVLFQRFDELSTHAHTPIFRTHTYIRPYTYTHDCTHSLIPHACIPHSIAIDKIRRF